MLVYRVSVRVRSRAKVRVGIRVRSRAKVRARGRLRSRGRFRDGRSPRRWVGPVG